MQLEPKLLLNKQRLKHISTYMWLTMTIVVFMIFSSFLSPYFFKFANFQNIIRSLAVTGILALGETFVILTGGIDLSVGGVLALSAIVATNYAGGNMVSFVLVAVLTGAVAGSLNGLGVISERMPAFITTLAVLNICRGASYVISKSMPIYLRLANYTSLSRMQVAGIPLPGFIFLMVALILVFVLRNLPFGRNLYAVGANANVARLSGVPVKRTMFFAYVISGMLAGLAACVHISYTSVAQPDAGSGYELDAIAMTVIGGTSLNGGRGGTVGTIQGVIIMALLRNIFNLLNIQTPTQTILMGCALAMAVIIQTTPKES